LQATIESRMRSKSEGKAAGDWAGDWAGRGERTLGRACGVDAVRGIEVT
jgi:hypothetical protein